MTLTPRQRLESNQPSLFHGFLQDITATSVVATALGMDGQWQHAMHLFQAREIHRDPPRISCTWQFGYPSFISEKTIVIWHQFSELNSKFYSSLKYFLLCSIQKM